MFSTYRMTFLLCKLRPDTMNAKVIGTSSRKVISRRTGVNDLKDGHDT